MTKNIGVPDYNVVRNRNVMLSKDTIHISSIKQHALWRRGINIYIFSCGDTYKTPIPSAFHIIS